MSSSGTARKTYAYARYTYAAKANKPPAGAGWLKECHFGTASDAGKTSVKVLWDGGAQQALFNGGTKVGQAIYHAAADYDWGYNINIVKLTVENAKIKAPAPAKWLSDHPGRYPQFRWIRFENETHHRGTGNKIEVKGVRFITAGFVQNVTVVSDNVTIKNKAGKAAMAYQPITGTPPHGKTDKLEDHSFLNGATKTSRTRTTPPWLDAKGEETKNAIWRGHVREGGHDTFEDQKKTTTTLSTFDTPWVRINLPAKLYLGGFWTYRSAIQVEFNLRLQVVVRTTDPLQPKNPLGLPIPSTVYTQEGAGGVAVYRYG